MKHLLRLLVALSFVLSLLAQDVPRDGGGGGRTSEWEPKKEDDTLFVVDEAADLDTSCTYRGGGPFRITLPIRRYVGEVNADGKLLNPDVLVNLGVISPRATLRMPVFDVDTIGNPNDPSTPPEVDVISVNGKQIGILSGETDEWKINEFTIDIRDLKFPRRGGPPAENVIEIRIDTANEHTGRQVWCTAVDWLELKFNAIAPVFLVHGVLAQGDTWVPSFTQFLTNQRVPHSAAINLGRVGSIRGNGNELARQLHSLAGEFGAKRCHIIAHSKGGLDTRAYLSGPYDPDRLKVQTVHTLSTPHHGSPVADIIVVLTAVLGRGTQLRKILSDLAPALDDLTSWNTFLFNFFNWSAPPGTRFFSYGADADLNNNNFISVDEAEWLPGGPVAASIWGTITYNYIGLGETVVLRIPPPDEWGENFFSGFDLQVVPFMPNDTLVSINSANYGEYVKTFDANHCALVKTAPVAFEILEHIKDDGSGGSAGQAPAEPQPPSTVFTTSMIRDAFQLTPAKRSETFTVTLDNTPSVTFFIAAASRTLNVTVQAPGGATHPVTMAPLESEGAQGAAYSVTVSNPLPGTWTITVAEPGPLTLLNVVAAEFLANSVRSVLAGGGDESYPLGGKIRLAHVVFDGTQRLRGLTVLAQLLDPAAPSTPVPITFRDDGLDADTIAGDGIYQAFVTPPAPGEYAVRVEALGTASTGAFRRSSATELRVVARDAEITDVREDGEDDDFDGLYDRIVITPYARVETAGKYEVFARLSASNGREIRRAVVADFPVGNVHADIPFAAEEIASSLGVDGPYTIIEVRLSRVTSDDVVPADVRYYLGLTDDYDLDDLEHLRIRLTGEGVARGLNTEGDRRNEYLQIELEVVAEESGTYSWSVALHDRNGREISFRTGDADLNEGTNTLVLIFPGEAIARNAVHGPWYVKNLALYGRGESLLVNDVFTTPPFRASDFGQPARRRTARH